MVSGEKKYIGFLWTARNTEEDNKDTQSHGPADRAVFSPLYFSGGGRCSLKVSGWLGSPPHQELIRHRVCALRSQLWGSDEMHICPGFLGETGLRAALRTNPESGPTSDVPWGWGEARPLQERLLCSVWSLHNPYSPAPIWGAVAVGEMTIYILSSAEGSAEISFPSHKKNDELAASSGGRDQWSEGTQHTWCVFTAQTEVWDIQRHSEPLYARSLPFPLLPSLGIRDHSWLTLCSHRPVHQRAVFYTFAAFLGRAMPKQLITLLMAEG